MGWGDVAREALSAAKDAFERVVRLEATLIAIKDAVERFEARVESNVHRQSESMRSEMRDFESRLREIERHLARTEAKVDGALAEAFRIALEQKRAPPLSEIRELSGSGENVKSERQAE
jgi:hypothetical protein